jgi:hypothetical protein
MASTYDDRRDSDRVPCKFLVRESALGGSFEEREGNLSIGGVYFAGLHPPTGSVIEVRFFVPGHEQEIEARGEVVRVSREGDQFGAHIRFTDILLESELALARFLQGRRPGAA